MAHPLGDLGRRHVLDGPAALQDELRDERLEVGEEQHVGDVARSDRAVLREPVPLGRVERRHHQRVGRVDARGDRVADHAVHVPVVGNVLRVPVVGAEGDPAGAVLLDERQERPEVPRHRGLADQEPDTRPQPLPPLLHRQHLVIRADAGGGVGLERVAEHARRVTVDVLRPLEPELRELVGASADDPGEVHHLGEAEHPLAAHERFEVAELERPSRRLERRRGDARGGHEEDLELEIGGDVMEPVDAVGAEDVRDLVRIRDDRGRPERQDESGELVREQLRGLDVHVRVDQPRHDVAAGGVDRLPALVRADAGDEPVDDRDIGGEPLPREDGQDAAAPHDEIGRLVPTGDGDATCKVGHGAGR